MNPEPSAENGNDDDDYDDDDDSDDDGFGDGEPFNVNYGLVTAIRALTVKGREPVLHNMQNSKNNKTFPERNPTKWKAIERLLDHNSRRDATASKDLAAIVDKLVYELGYSQERCEYI